MLPLRPPPRRSAWRILGITLVVFVAVVLLAVGGCLVVINFRFR